jgi:fibronectin type 3 domain-containing protein
VELLTRYFYAISAVDSSENVGSRSTPVSVTTLGLARPRNVRANAGPQEIVIDWSANSEQELTGYEVLRFTDPTQADPEKMVSTVLTTFVDSPLVAGQTYVYRVQALGSGGLESELSNFASATVPVDTDAPASPGVLSAVLISDAVIQLTWSAPKTDADGTALTGLSGYRVYRSEGSGGAGFQFVGSVDSVLVTFADIGLEQATTFIYRVSALDASGNESAFSSSVSLTTGSSDDISAPTNVAALALDDPDLGLVVRVTWSAPSGITEYRVQRQTVGSTSSATFETVVSSQNDTSFNDTNVERGKTYIYRVLSKSGSAFSEASDSVVVAVPTL